MLGLGLALGDHSRVGLSLAIGISGVGLQEEGASARLCVGIEALALTVGRRVTRVTKALHAQTQLFIGVVRSSLTQVINFIRSCYG